MCKLCFPFDLFEAGFLEVARKVEFADVAWPRQLERRLSNLKIS